MKKLLRIALSSVAVGVAAQQPPGGATAVPRVIPFGGALPAKDKPIEDAALKEMIFREVCNTHVPPVDQRPQGWSRLTTQDLADWYKIPAERMARVLEELIREKLAEQEMLGKDRDTLVSLKVSAAIRQLKGFHGPNTLALLRECAFSPEMPVSHRAVETYITILGGGGDSAAFLREVYAKGRFPNMGTQFYRLLNDTVEKLKEQGRNDDVEKLHTFMLDMIQAEQDASDANQIDAVLCVTLEGYAQSTQREQVVLKFVNSDEPWTRNRFGELKVEMDNVPAGKRTDLSKRFNLTELKKEK